MMKTQICALVLGTFLLVFLASVDGLPSPRGRTGVRRPSGRTGISVSVDGLPSPSGRTGVRGPTGRTGISVSVDGLPSPRGRTGVRRPSGRPGISDRTGFTGWVTNPDARSRTGPRGTTGPFSQSELPSTSTTGPVSTKDRSEHVSRSTLPHTSKRTGKQQGISPSQPSSKPATGIPPCVCPTNAVTQATPVPTNHVMFSIAPTLVDDSGEKSNEEEEEKQGEGDGEEGEDDEEGEKQGEDSGDEDEDKNKENSCSRFVVGLGHFTMITKDITLKITLVNCQESTCAKEGEDCGKRRTCKTSTSKQWCKGSVSIKDETFFKILAKKSDMFTFVKSNADGTADVKIQLNLRKCECRL